MELINFLSVEEKRKLTGIFIFLFLILLAMLYDRFFLRSKLTPKELFDFELTREEALTLVSSEINYMYSVVAKKKTRIGTDEYVDLLLNDLKEKEGELYIPKNFESFYICKISNDKNWKENMIKILKEKGIEVE